MTKYDHRSSFEKSKPGPEKTEGASILNGLCWVVSYDLTCIRVRHVTYKIRSLSTIIMQTTISPHSQKPLVSRSYPSQSDLDVAIQNASKAQKLWRKVPLEERVDIGRKFMVRSYGSERVQVWLDHSTHRMSSERCRMK